MSLIKAYLTIVFFVLATHASLSQDYVIKTSPILESILKTKGSIALIHQNRPNKFLPIEDARIQAPETPNQVLLKSNTGLYILLNGTGQVFKAIADDQRTVTFRRLDQTVFTGNNFGSIVFSLQDTLYSFGGYGFWHTNGQLRYFTSNNDWELRSVQPEIPLISDLNCVLPDHQEIYYTTFADRNKTPIKLDELSIYKLDYSKKENTELGLLLAPILASSSYINIDSQNGSLIRTHDGISFIDWQANKIYKLRDNDKFKFLRYRPAVVYYHHDTIFYALTIDDEITKVPFSVTDINKSTHEQFYQPVGRRKNQMLFTALVLGLVTILSLLTLLRYHKRKAIKSRMASNDLSESLLLTNVHVSFLEFILQNNLQGIALTTEAVNTFLGLEKKPMDVQKRQRREIITKINAAYHTLNHTDQLLINRLRATGDKRYFTYQVENDLITKFISQLSPGKRKE